MYCTIPRKCNICQSQPRRFRTILGRLQPTGPDAAEVIVVEHGASVFHIQAQSGEASALRHEHALRAVFGHLDHCDDSERCILQLRRASLRDADSLPTNP